MEMVYTGIDQVLQEPVIQVLIYSCSLFYSREREIRMYLCALDLFLVFAFIAK